jgi:phosphoglycerol transferase MdoB-like AlkP superfamily enzyme
MARRGARLPVALLACACALAAASARAAEPALAWELVSAGTPRVFWADRNHDIRIRVRNLGTATWSEAAGDHLSYHWRTRDGAMVERDGLRARLAGPVRPGESAELMARVHAPARSGRWLLEWEMVREQVAWYGPPAGGAARVSVLVLWRCSLLQVGFCALTLVLALVARRLPRAHPLAREVVAALGPLAWTWGALVLVTVTFSELVGCQLWRGGGTLAASGAALLALPVALVPARLRRSAALMFAVAVSALAAADAVYLRYFDAIVPAVALAAARQVGQIEGSVRALLRPTDLWLLGTAASACLFALLWPGPARAAIVPRGARHALRGAGIALALAAGVPALGALHAALHDPAFADQVFSQRALLGRWGVVNVHLFDLARTVREWRARPSAADVAAVEAFFDARAAQHAGDTGASPAVARGANLILIQVESLQQWVVGARVRGVEVTPFLNALCGEALAFTEVFDQTGQGRSSDAEFEVLNSLHALDRGAVAFRRPHNRFVAVPGLLRERGYHTLSGHGFERGFWNRALLHPRYGFEDMVFRPELGQGEVIGWGLADAVFLERMADRLAALPHPFFAFLITLGLHHPFDGFPDRHKTLDVGELAGTALGNYIHAMHYCDGALASFMARLRASGVLDTSVVAIYGDHESGLAVDAPLLALAGMSGDVPGAALRLRRVPFFVRVPGGRPSGESGVIGGHIDVAPTLLALLGVPQPPVFLGHALRDGTSSVAVLNDGSVVGDGLILIASGAGVPAQGLCQSFPGVAARPLADCAQLAERGRRELAASRFVVLNDLAPEIAHRRAP